jgi:hypothetical protein
VLLPTSLISKVVINFARPDRVCQPFFFAFAASPFTLMHIPQIDSCDHEMHPGLGDTRATSDM